MMTVTLQEHTARQLTKVAHEQANSPEALVEKAIRGLLRTAADRILTREMDTFRTMHPSQSKYCGYLDFGVLSDGHGVRRSKFPILQEIGSAAPRALARMQIT